MEELPLSKVVENTIQEYFEGHSWTVQKLDNPSRKEKEKASDYLLTGKGHKVLVEVKTIQSDRANIPWGSPREHLEHRRQQFREEIEAFVNDNPEERVKVTADEWEFMHGEDAEVRKKFLKRRSTLSGFNRFKKTIEDHFSQPELRKYPVRIRLDSDDLYQPCPQQAEEFLKWLTKETIDIINGKPGNTWTTQSIADEITYYSNSYEFREKTHRRGRLQISVEKLPSNCELEINIHSYGTINLDAITRNIQKGVAQLQSSAEFIGDLEIPRTVIIHLPSGIYFESWQQLHEHISWLFEQFPNVSAIVVMEWKMENDQMAPDFVVYHNENLKSAKPLPKEIFDHNHSTHIEVQ
ncbi:MAG: hypothetical protein JXB38_21150 [Anaerolineales bacterium]|nr:hypothetical protein [Anaerolineales bacterium]